MSTIKAKYVAAPVNGGTVEPLVLQTNNLDRAVIDSSGNLGIGTTSPIRKLTVSQNGSPEFVLQDTSQAANSRNWRIFNSGNSVIIGTLNDAGNAGSDKMILDSSGNVKLADGAGRFLNSSGNPIVAQTGSVLQVQSTYHTSSTQLTSSGALHELTSSLRVSITPVSSSSTLFIECFGSFMFPQSNHLQWAAIYNVTDSAYVNLPPASGSRKQVHWINRTTSFDVNDADFMYFAVRVANTSTTARTYSVYHGTEGAVAQFLSSTLSSASGATYPLFLKVTEIAA